MKPTSAQMFERVGVRVPRILLPRTGVDLYRWAVIACDQHTSEPDYWTEVEETVGDSPSTLRLIYPEIYLDEASPDARIGRIHETMTSYLTRGILEDVGESMLLTRRATPYVAERRGLLLALDLDEYDYTPGAQSLIRATEETIVERIPPRVRIREGAAVELPHVLVLVDDPGDLLFSGLAARRLDRLYSTELMLAGGRVDGYRVDGEALDHVAATLVRLLEESDAQRPFLFAVGDGNHSLATAKAVREQTRATAPDDDPARFALVEVVNLYDPGLRFEPIHRLIRAPEPRRWVERCAGSLGCDVEEFALGDLERAVRDSSPAVGFVAGEYSGILRMPGGAELPVGAVQSYINEQQGAVVDYIHGWDASVGLGRKPDSVAIMLPDFDPRLLFPTVAERGVLPRKAFSLGEAEEKRYYLEARRIS